MINETKTFGGLFRYLHRHNLNGHFDLRITKEYAGEYFEYVKKVLRLHGGFDDMEVVMNCETEIAWDRKLDTPLDRKEWNILAEDEWDAPAVKAGFYGRCWYCGEYFNLWMAPDKEWVKSGCQGMICKECFNRVLKEEKKWFLHIQRCE